MNTKKLSLFIVISLCVGFLSFTSAQDVVKILAIGNSFSTDAAESYVDDLAKADGLQLIIANMYIGGCSLETHWKNAERDSAAYSYRKIINGDTTVVAKQKLSTAMQDEDWDYITFQQASPYSGLIDSYFPYLTNLVAYTQQLATNPDVQFAFHQTWAYAANSTHKGFKNYNNDQQQMYEAIVGTVNAAVKQAGIDIVIPAGTAIQNGRTSCVGDHFCRDGYHLSLGLGRFTAACTWYEKLLKRPVIDNSFIPSGVTQEEAKVAKHAAHNAVKQPNRVTPMP
ncbi:MAG: DUF4886 domain-containing protein [Paludibacter sp.]|nr:DUF4886 domain-containing protein [Paludibacter sp.]